MSIFWISLNFNLRFLLFLLLYALSSEICASNNIARSHLIDRDENRYFNDMDNSNEEAVVKALTLARTSLVPQGRIIIRDFLAPDYPEKNRPVILKHLISDIKTGVLNKVPREINCSNFASDFRNATNKGHSSRREISCKELRFCDAGYRCYETNLETACEFIYRKDYDDSYGAELNERYGFIDKQHIHDLIKNCGLKLMTFKTLSNPWIIETRLRNKIILEDPETKTSIEYPHYQFLVVAEK